MVLKSDPESDFGSDAPFPTVKHLFSQLRSSFFLSEFDRVEKTLVEREEHSKAKQAELEKRVESLQKEKDLLILEKVKMNDELKKKGKECEKLRRENVEHCDEIRVLKRKGLRDLEVEGEMKKKERVYEKMILEFGERVLKLEKVAKDLVDLGEAKDCVAERSKPPLFDKKGDSAKNIKPKPREVIQIDDDDDDEDDQKVISTLKRKRVSEIRKEKDDDDDENSSCSDDENVDLLKSIAARRKMQKER